MIFNVGKIAADAFINKNTAIGNDDKKQHFFNGKVPQLEARDISFVEAPNADGGKINIPNHIAKCRQKHCGKKVFPFFIKPYFLIKAKHQWPCQRCCKNKKISILVIHINIQWVKKTFFYLEELVVWALVLLLSAFTLSQYCFATKSMPKLSPSCFSKCLWCILCAQRMVRI